MIRAQVFAGASRKGRAAKADSSLRPARPGKSGRNGMQNRAGLRSE